MSMTYRAIEKVGTRGREWLIVNEHGGLKCEYSGNKAAAEYYAKQISTPPAKGVKL